jgi:hypothetical protein
MGTPNTKRAKKYGMRNAPPPFLYTKYGNLQNDPNPTANPIKERQYS